MLTNVDKSVQGSILEQMKSFQIDTKLLNKLEKCCGAPTIFDYMLLWSITENQFLKKRYLEELNDECNFLCN